jgi:hypothetical protein
LGVLLASTLFVGSASAADAREQSRAAFRKGVTLAKENDYAGAREAFAEAYRLFPHPSILLNLGIARGRSGQLVDAEQDLVKFLADDGGASPEEIKSARQMLADVRDKLATLSLDVKTPGAAATLDGKPIALVPDQAVPVRATAGQHALHVEADGYVAADQNVDLVSKIETPLVVTLVARPDENPRAAVGGGHGVPRATIGWVLVGGSVALAGAGTFFGLRTLALRRDWNAFTASEQEENPTTKSRGSLYRTLTDVLFIGAAVAAAAGVYFLVVKPSDAAKGSAGLVLGPAFSGVKGRF